MNLTIAEVLAVIEEHPLGITTKALVSLLRQRFSELSESVVEDKLVVLQDSRLIMVRFPAPGESQWYVRTA